MTTPSAKVLCGDCERLLCHICDTPRGLAYKLTVGKRGGWTDTPAGVWCPEHGWPDLSGLKLRPGKAVTLRAKMLPRSPAPQ
jgi:hypothetical protein